jgi:hypothetical protein
MSHRYRFRRHLRGLCAWRFAIVIPPESPPEALTTTTNRDHRSEISGYGGPLVAVADVA